MGYSVEFPQNPVLADYELVHVRAICRFVNHLNLKSISLLDPNDPDPSTYDSIILQLLSNLSEKSYLFLLERIDHKGIQNYILTKLSDNTLLDLVSKNLHIYLPLFDHFDDPLPLIEHVVARNDDLMEFELYRSMLKRNPSNIKEDRVLKYLDSDQSLYVVKALIHFVFDETVLTDVILSYDHSEITYQVLDRVQSVLLLNKIYNSISDPSILTQVRYRIDLLS